MDPRALTLRANLAPAQIRKAEYEGRPHTVVPVRMIAANAVMNGVQYPSSVQQMALPQWADMPVTAGHPTDASGNPIDVNASPKELEKWRIGRVAQPQWNDGTVAEIWFDDERVEAIYPGGLARINSVSDQIDVSTGMYVFDSPISNVKDADTRADGFMPNHLATLFDEEGACNWGDGCGLRSHAAVLMTNAKTAGSIYTQAASIVAGIGGTLTSVGDDSFTYDDEGFNWVQPYAVNSNGIAVLSVDRSVASVAVGSGSAGDGLEPVKSIIDPAASGMDPNLTNNCQDPAKREAAIATLIEQGTAKESDKADLLALSDNDFIDRLMGNCACLAGKADEAEKRAKDAEKKVEANTAALASRLNAAIDRASGERAEVIARMANAAGIEPATVNQILANDIDKPPLSRLRGFARVLDVGFEQLARDAGYMTDEISDNSSNSEADVQAQIDAAILAERKRVADEAEVTERATLTEEIVDNKLSTFSADELAEVSVNILRKIAGTKPKTNASATGPQGFTGSGSTERKIVSNGQWATNKKETV